MSNNIKKLISFSKSWISFAKVNISKNLDNDSKLIDKPGVMNYREIRYKRSSKWSKSIQWSIVAAVSFGFVYSVFTRIDEVVIARGDLQAEGAERPIKSPLAGVVKSILVKEGQLVSKNTSLLTLDSEVNESRISSLLMQLKGEQLRLDSELQAYNARLSSLNSQLTSLKKTTLTSQYIYDRYTSLHELGALSLLARLEKQDELQRLQAQVSQLRSTIDEVNAEAAQARQSIEKEIFSIKRELTESRKAKEYQNLKSPIDGFIFDLVPSSPGYAVNNGETLLKVVPNGLLSAKVSVTNIDIGFIKEGMSAKIRVDAFPFTQFGDIDGVVSSISTEAKEPDQNNPQSRFIVVVKLSKQYLEDKNQKRYIKPGQTVTANFIVRDKPVISLLTDAIEKSLDSLRGIKTDQN